MFYGFYMLGMLGVHICYAPSLQLEVTKSYLILKNNEL